MASHSTMEPAHCNIPGLSRLAWERLIMELKPGAPDFLPSNLRIAALPGAAGVFGQSPEDWVPRYECLRESIEKKARRQGQPQTGVFYTPRWVARYLTAQTLGKTLDHLRNDIDVAISVQQWEQAHTLLNTAKSWRVIDPACGTGVFLVEALLQWHAFYQQVNGLFSAPVVKNPVAHILQSQLYGLDLDPLSVMLTEMRLMQCAHQLEAINISEVLLELQSHLRCANTLAQPVFDESFRWHFVLGNPPYISETRKQAQLFRGLQAQESTYYQAKMDLCDAFLAWAIDHVLPDGQLAYVLPEYWTQRTSTRALREQLWKQGALCEFWQLSGHRVFRHAPGHHSSLLIWQKRAPLENPISTQTAAMGIATSPAELAPERLQPASFTVDAKSGALRYGNPLASALLAKLSEHPPLLAKCEIQQGLVMPQGRLKIADWHRLPLDIQAKVLPHCGVFLLTDAEISALALTDAERALLKPYYGPAGFRPFSGFSTQQPLYQIIYGNLENRKLIEKHPLEYRQIRAHLDRFHAINTSAFAPYGLHRPRQTEWFEDARKILCPRQVPIPALAVVEFPAYVNEGFYSLRSSQHDPHYICGLLNSRLAWFWFYHHKRKGERLQIDKDVLSVFPSPVCIGQAEKHCIAELSRQLSKEPQSDNLRNVLNEMIYEFYQLSRAETALVESAYRSIVGK